MNEHDHSRFEQQARTVLRASANELDGATRSQLAKARTAALAQRRTSRRWLEVGFLAPAGAVTAALFVTMLFVARDASDRVTPSAGAALYDLDLLADADAYELSQETDLEFIEWAAAMGEQGRAGT